MINQFFISCLVISFLSIQAHCIDKFPDRPNGKTLLFDYADIINQDDEDTIKFTQSKVFAVHDVSIVIITIQSMSNLSSSPGNIESFAQRWFNYWGLGSQENNTAILLLLSTQDRKARIELGEEWGRDWDEHCLDIMQTYMIPHFKQDNYAVGIQAGLVHLEEMAVHGTDINAPQKSWYQRLHKNILNKNTPMPISISFWIFLTGIALSVWGLLYMRNITLFICGILFVILAIAIWLIFLPVFIMYLLRSNSDHAVYQESFSGGSSGGGGATASW